MLDHLHQYVPATSVEVQVPVEGQETSSVTTTDDTFHHILFGKSGRVYSCMSIYAYNLIFTGGDQMTVARIRGSKGVVSNSQSGTGRLEGLVPVVEDWHTKMCLLEVRIP